VETRQEPQVMAPADCTDIYTDMSTPMRLHQLMGNHVVCCHREEPLDYNPIQRDTATVNAKSYLVLRFVADNKGAW